MPLAICHHNFGNEKVILSAVWLVRLFEDSSVSPSLSQRSHNPASPSEFAMSSYTIAQLEVALQGMDRKIQDALAHGTIFETIEQNTNGLVRQHVQNSKDIYLPCLLCIAIQRRIFAMSKSSQPDVKKVFDCYQTGKSGGPSS